MKMKTMDVDNDDDDDDEKMENYSEYKIKFNVLSIPFKRQGQQ